MKKKNLMRTTVLMPVDSFFFPVNLRKHLPFVKLPLSEQCLCLVEIC